MKYYLIKFLGGLVLISDQLASKSDSFIYESDIHSLNVPDFNSYVNDGHDYKVIAFEHELDTSQLSPETISYLKSLNGRQKDKIEVEVIILENKSFVLKELTKQK